MIVPNDVLMPEVERLLREGRDVVLKARGNSMLPFIRDRRDSVLICPVTDGQVAAGDIVLARVNGTNVYVLHRIVDISGNKVILMGDGNLRGREICRTGDICGKVVKIMCNGKETDPYSRTERWKVYLWLRLLPLRRWLLAFYRLPDYVKRRLRR